MNIELLFKVGILALSIQLIGCTRSEVSFSTDVQPILEKNCIACHDSENSPEFDYETYWTRIQHGELLAVPAPASEDDR